MSTETTRRHPRYLAETRCVVTPTEGGARLLADRVLDISYSGLRVNALAPARIGERVEIALAIPGSSFWVEAEGEVARCLVGRRADDPGASYGLVIRRMHGMDRIVMANSARGRRPVPAGASRGPRRDYAQAILRISES